MEVACSFDEFARVFAEDGYINEASYFNDASDLPSMLRVFESKTVLDSPESFPESPCSDEDIARVLEITQMPSPSLLESCLPDSFVNLPTSHNGVFDTNNVNVTKTRDPCITNAVLHDIFSNTTTANYPERVASSLDGFCISSNVFSHSASVNLNHIINAKENDAISTSYFDSTPVLSPLSDTDTIPCTPSNYQDTIPRIPSNYQDTLPSTTSHYQEQISSTSSHYQKQTILTNEHVVQINLGEDNVQQTFETIQGNVSVHQTLDETRATNAAQIRKRKRKTYSKSSKSRKGKNKDTNQTAKPQPKPKKAKISEEKFPEKQANSLSNKNQCDQKPPIDKSSVKQEQSQLNHSQSETNDVTTTTDQKEEPTLRRSSRSTRNTENYNFRLSSLVKRVETEKRQKEPKQPKGKDKPPPLSKYRRRTANARERDRMKEINDAFDNLKETLPAVGEESKQKETKFTILKLALNYISALRDMLGYNEFDPSFNSTDFALSQSSVSSESLYAESPSNTEHVNFHSSDSNNVNIKIPLEIEESLPSSISTCSTSNGINST